MEMKMGTPYVLLEEQETTIRYGRLDDYATICTSDTTQKTRFDKLCKNSPGHWGKQMKMKSSANISVRQSRLSLLGSK